MSPENLFTSVFPLNPHMNKENVSVGFWILDQVWELDNRNPAYGFLIVRTNGTDPTLWNLEVRGIQHHRGFVVFPCLLVCVYKRGNEWNNTHLRFMTRVAHFLIKRRRVRTNTISEAYFFTCMVRSFIRSFLPSFFSFFLSSRSQAGLQYEEQFQLNVV